MMGQQQQVPPTAPQFPMECTQLMFSYLELVDCIRFASTSSISLREVLPTIRIRRDRMMQTYGVMMINTATPTTNCTAIATAIPRQQTRCTDITIGIVNDDIRKSANCSSSRNHHSSECCIQQQQQLLYEFPTVQQRVAQLAKKIPYRHPMYGTVQQLHQSLQVLHQPPPPAISTTTTTTTTTAVSLSICIDFDDTWNLIALLQQYLLPMKLHATILYHTVLSKHHCYNNKNDNNNASTSSNATTTTTTTTTTLDNYVGDVLCVTYLLYDFTVGGCDDRYAEHSRTPQWLTNKLQIHVPTVYQSWVLLHASILRTKSFTLRQRIRLGFVSSPFTLSDDDDDDDGPEPLTTIDDNCFHYIDTMNALIRNPDRFVQSCPANRLKSTPTTLSISSSSLSLLCGGWDVGMFVPIRTDAFVKSEMCVVYDDFGSLMGATFRGRDIVQVWDVTADAMTECILLFHHQLYSTSLQTTNEASHIDNNNNNMNHNNNITPTVREAIEWICIVHEQTYKSRPMSVRIPMIRFN